MLEDGYHDVPPGHVAAVVTHLEMRARPEERPVPALDGIELTREERPARDWYLGLFQKIGKDWLWFGRLAMDTADLDALLQDPKVEIYALRKDGVALGLLELDFRQEGECELAYFGLAPELVGSGAGRWLMARAIDRAFQTPITRFHVHTCTNDSSAALPFYIRSGFVPTRQQVEIAPDPRLTGFYPENAAPHIPVFR
ncbi:MAG: GNAT family N-acetyltransferase [Rhodobacterales bacterium]|nr:MAG: GNAT family N-acetyltransferase [Rhodobacterales bacterium]